MGLIVSNFFSSLDGAPGRRSQLANHSGVRLVRLVRFPGSADGRRQPIG